MPIASAIGGSVVSGLFGRSSAKRSISFQREMAHNAFQYQTQDLEAAGLNRILGMSGTGARASGGAMPPTPDFAGSAIQARRVAQEIKNMQAVERRTDAETELTKMKIGSIGPVGTTGAAIVSSARGASNLWYNRQWLGKPPPSSVTFPIEMDRQQPSSAIGFRKIYRKYRKP